MGRRFRDGEGELRRGSRRFLELLPPGARQPLRLAIVFSTPKENFVGLRHKNPEQFITDIQKHDYEVRFYCEFWLGVGFLLGEAVFAIVPDGYDPKAAISSTREGATGKWITSKVEDNQESDPSPENPEESNDPETM